MSIDIDIIFYNEGEIMRDIQPLQEQAYEYLIEKIKNGDLEADTIYSLNQMAKNYGFSRTPFRDAVLRLEQERYLDMIPSKGFVLHKMTEDDIIETYQLRSAIERYCFKQLSEHLDTERGQQYFQKLSTKVAMQKEIMMTTASAEDFGRKDYEFHRSLVQYVGNESMLEIYRRFMYRIFWLIVTSFSRKGRMEETVQEHTLFLEKIKSHDIAGLEELLEHHLRTPEIISLSTLSEEE